MGFRCFLHMVRCLGVVALSVVSVFSGFGVIAVAVVLGGLFVMLGGLRVVFCGLGVVFCGRMGCHQRNSCLLGLTVDR